MATHPERHRHRPATCMELIPNGPGRFYWCDLPADPRSEPRAPRCPKHYTMANAASVVDGF